MSDVCVCMRDVISEFNSEIKGSLAFCALMLYLCSILCLMCLSVWRMMFVKMVFCRVYVRWWLNVRESSPGVCGELCQDCFPIVRECVSVLL